MKTLLACLCLAIVLPASAQPPAEASEATAAIARLREGLVSSFRQGDIDALLTHLDPEVVVTWQNAELCRGPEAVRAFYHRMMTGDRRVVREIQSDPEVLGRQAHGDWAVSWGNLRDHFILNDGSDLPLNSAFTATIAKRGDRWLVTAFHASVNVFDNPVLGLAARKTALWSGLGGGGLGLVLGLIGARLFGRRKAA